MFVYNVKFNKNTFFKTLLAVFSIVCVAIAAVAIFKIFKDSNKETLSGYNCLPNSDTAEIQAENYTNILKMVNDDLDTYIGQKISFTGYVYRVSDIKDDEFILARDMKVSDNPKQTLVVGFLSKYKNAKELQNNTWIKITGTIEKGYYCGEVPLLNISNLEKISKPENAEVPVPDDYYVPTAVIY